MPSLLQQMLPRPWWELCHCCAKHSWRQTVIMAGPSFRKHLCLLPRSLGRTHARRDTMMGVLLPDVVGIPPKQQYTISVTRSNACQLVPAPLVPGLGERVQLGAGVVKHVYKGVGGLQRALHLAAVVLQHLDGHLELRLQRHRCVCL